MGRVFAGVALATLLTVMLLGVQPHPSQALTVPTVTVPTVTVPTVTVPTVTVPTITVPTITVPTITVPAVTVPSVTVPAVTVPKTTPLPVPPVRTQPISTPSVASTPSSVGGGRSSSGSASGAGPVQTAGHGSATGRSSPLAGAASFSVGGGSSVSTTASGGATSAAGAAGAGRLAGRSLAHDRLLSQQRLRKLVVHHPGCLSALDQEENKVLILRTGVGLTHPYSRRQVASVLHLTLRQEGRLERDAVNGLMTASAHGRCGNPLESLGPTVHLEAQAALSLFTGTLGTSSSSTATAPANVRLVPVRSRSQSAARGKSAGGGIAAHVRSATLATPPHGGFDWLMLAVLLAAGATIMLLTLSPHRLRRAIGPNSRAHPRDGATSKLRHGASTGARLVRDGAEALGGAVVGLLARRGTLTNRRRRHPPGPVALLGTRPEAGAKPVALQTSAESAPAGGSMRPDDAAVAGSATGALPVDTAVDPDARIEESIEAFELGGELAEKNDLAGAEAAYRWADRWGHPSGASNLGALLERRGDLAGAEAAYRRADERGDAGGAFNLGGLLEEGRDFPGAEAAYRRADQRGDGAAATRLGAMLERRGDIAGAEAAFRRADERGDTAGTVRLGMALEQRGDLATAEAAYRRADRRGDPVSSFRLGVLLEHRNDLAGAEAAYSRAAERGRDYVADLARAALTFLRAHR